jgi:hypothetical protein
VHPETKVHALAVLLGPAVAMHGIVQARRLLKDAAAFVDELERAVVDGPATPAETPASRALAQPHSISGGAPQSPTSAAFAAPPPPAAPALVDDGGSVVPLAPVANLSAVRSGMLPMQAADVEAAGGEVSPPPEE